MSGRRSGGGFLANEAAEGSETLVALDADRETVGFCTLSMPSRDEDADDQTAEVAATYVAPECWRTGIGRALLTAALSKLREAGWARRPCGCSTETTERARSTRGSDSSPMAAR